MIYVLLFYCVYPSIHGWTDILATHKIPFILKSVNQNSPINLLHSFNSTNLFTISTHTQILQVSNHLRINTDCITNRVHWHILAKTKSNLQSPNNFRPYGNLSILFQRNEKVQLVPPYPSSTYRRTARTMWNMQQSF